MAQLASDIQAEGFVPGLWMAPMYVHRDTDTYQDHPDWWVRDLTGAELRFSNLGTGDYAVLDVTHPDAADWLTGVIETKVDEGWEYFKFDFLYAAAQVGLRHEPVTGIEAYHRALALLRSAVGDRWMLACGAPMLPSVGYAQSYRSGADIAFGFDRTPELAYLRWQARSTAARSFSNGRWWWLDADQILVRPPFDRTAATGAIAANVVSGGVWMLGDDLTALSDTRLQLAMREEAVALRGQTPVPDAPLSAISGLDGGPVLEHSRPDDSVPTTWRLPDGTVVLMNLSESEVTLNGPGGLEVLSGATAEPGPRTLASGAGEIWQP
jgi:alpha-galactosidase